MPAMVFLKRAEDLRFELFNRAGEQLLGYSRTDLLGKNDHDLFPQEQADFFTQKDRAVLESRRLLEIAEEPIKTADGSEKWLHTFKIGLYDEAGHPTHLLGISVDITARKRMEDELRESESKLAEAQRMAHLGHWQLDLRTNELMWSDEIFRIFEIDPQQFGATYEAFLAGIHPDDREAVNTAYTDSLKERSSFQIEHRLLMKDGRVKYVLEKCETTFDDEGKPLRSLGTVQDVTVTKFAERALREQQQVLQQALEGTIHTVSMAVELRDPYTAGHQRRVAELALRDRAGDGAGRGTHQRCPFGIDDSRHRQDRGAGGGTQQTVTADPDRVQIVQEHAAMGYNILEETSSSPGRSPRSPISTMSAWMVPVTRRGSRARRSVWKRGSLRWPMWWNQWPLHRPYRPGLGMPAALDEIVGKRGALYDAQVVDACRQVLEQGFKFE